MSKCKVMIKSGPEFMSSLDISHKYGGNKLALLDKVNVMQLLGVFDLYLYGQRVLI